MKRWQATVDQLANSLPREGRGKPADLVTEPLLQLLRGGFREAEGLLKPPPQDAFLTLEGWICWCIYPYLGQGFAWREEQVRYVLQWSGIGDEQTPVPWLELRQVLPKVQKHFLSLPASSDKKVNGYATIVPILAELDPAFALQALDRRRLVAEVEINPALIPTERALMLRLLRGPVYTGCLCTGLAMVVEALANNHFQAIAPLLALPDIHSDSYWCGLIPKILLVTLYQKVLVLRDLARKM